MFECIQKFIRTHNAYMCEIYQIFMCDCGCGGGGSKRLFASEFPSQSAEKYYESATPHGISTLRRIIFFNGFFLYYFGVGQCNAILHLHRCVATKWQ